MSSFSGGFGMISSWVTLAAPCLLLVPTQSLPVSPPPITITCLPVAVSEPRGAARTSSSPALRLFCWVRNSIASRTPLSSDPGMSSMRASSAPPASTTASKFSCSAWKLTSTPTSLEVRNWTPSASICTARRFIRCFSILKSGMPYRSSPPMRSDFSNTVTAWPARASCCAQASPAGPLPMTATDLPVRFSGTSGLTQPSWNPRSMIAHSIDLMVTGLSTMLSVQAASHGAGQTRPVNSGKLLVECSTSSAFFQSSS